MLNEKTPFTQRERSVDECLEVLRPLDERTLRRRAERLAKVPQITSSTIMPSWTTHLMDEAVGCFVDGYYNGCVLALAAGVEYGLRELLEKPKGRLLAKLISEAEEAGKIDDGEAKILRSLRGYRNSSIHSDIHELAGAIRLHQQEEIGLGSEEQEEIAAMWKAEKEVEDLLIKVREAIHGLCGRQSTSHTSSV